MRDWKPKWLKVGFEPFKIKKKGKTRWCVCGQKMWWNGYTYVCGNKNCPHNREVYV